MNVNPEQKAKLVAEKPVNTNAVPPPSKTKALIQKWKIINLEQASQYMER